MPVNRQNRFKMSVKQRQIMEVLCAGNTNADGHIINWCDMDQLIQRVPYTVSKDAMNFSVRYLIQKGLAVKGKKEVRRGRRRTIIVPSEIGFSMVKPAAPERSMITDDIVETW